MCVLMFQLPVNDELVWDNGTPFPEPCIDRIADTVGKVTLLSCPIIISISYYQFQHGSIVLYCIGQCSHIVQFQSLSFALLGFGLIIRKIHSIL